MPDWLIGLLGLAGGLLGGAWAGGRNMGELTGNLRSVAERVGRVESSCMRHDDVLVVHEAEIAKQSERTITIGGNVERVEKSLTERLERGFASLLDELRHMEKRLSGRAPPS